MEKHNKDCSCGNGNVFNTVLLVILVILSAFQVAFILGITPNFSKEAKQTPTTNNSNGMEKVVRDALLEHEYAKVGGKENYKTITDLQIELLKYPQYEGNIDAQKEMLKNLKNGTGIADSEPTVTATPAGSLSDEQKTKILESAVIEGNKEADIMVVEYSEMECPFCAQQYHDTKIKENLKSEFGDKVAFSYKNNRGVDHAGTEAKALGLLCAGKVGGDEAYVKFYEHVMDNTTLRPQNRSGSVFPVASLAEAAKAAGITDVAAWQSCVDNKEMLAKFTAETNEAKSIGLSGTPGTLLFNQKTGKYTTISGAYPYENFQAAVNSLLQ